MRTATNRAMLFRHIAPLCAALLCAFCTGAHGQIVRPPVPQFSLAQLRFAPVNSAARPTGLGGAFLGVANDATAAAINPAGVAFLARPEISLSQAWGRSTREFPLSATSDKSESATRFYGTLVNIIYPFQGFTFALYRRLAFRSEYKFEREQFLAFSAARALTLHEQLGAAGNFPGMRSEFAFEVWQDAFVIAKTIKRGVRIGAALLATQLRFGLHEQHYFAPELWLQPEVRAGTVGPNRAGGLYRIYHARHNEFQPAWNLGVLFELHKNFSVGAAYHHLPSYSLAHQRTLPAYSLPARTPNGNREDFQAEAAETSFGLNLPDNWGLGLAWKPDGRNLIALDVVFHRSKTLLQGSVQNLPQDDLLTAAGDYVDPDHRADLVADDFVALRAGVERLLLFSQTKMPVRLGFYNEPFFGLRAVVEDANLKREYPEAEARWHVTGGTGVIIKNFRFEVSLDFGAEAMEAIGSAVVSF